MLGISVFSLVELSLVVMILCSYRCVLFCFFIMEFFFMSWMDEVGYEFIINLNLLDKKNLLVLVLFIIIVGDFMSFVLNVLLYFLIRGSMKFLNNLFFFWVL